MSNDAEILETTEQIRIRELEEQLLMSQKQNVALTQRGLVVRQENEILKVSEEITLKRAEMEYEMDICKKFIDGGAFKVKTPEQAYTIVQAGKEMGLSPIRSLNTLAIINGTIGAYGDGMVGMITGHGYRIEYLNEKPGVELDIRVSKGDEVYEEHVKITDPALAKSQAKGFAPYQKLRYHAVRQVKSFLFGSLVWGHG